MAIITYAITRTEEEAAQSRESDDAFGAQKRGENQIPRDGGDIPDGREDPGARCPAQTKRIHFSLARRNIFVSPHGARHIPRAFLGHV